MMRRLVLPLAVLGCQAIAQPTIPKLEQRVSDLTNTLSYVEWNSLEQMLKTFEDTTSTQIVVLMVNSLEGGSIEDFAVEVFEENKIGQKGKDNGALLVVAKDDRVVRIEVGYGLEGSLTDALCDQIIDREITPRFREGNFYGGLLSAVNSMIAATAGEYTVDARGRQAPLIAVALLFIFGIFFFFILLPFVISRRKYIISRSGWTYNPGWGYRSGGWGEGSGGSSGGSSWSGGGGLSGGGGATGRW
ncbi:MAG: TPM domain-containing protein [Ignavibacteriales bacterium]|nr:TPM domain-containing protein [Ignavibacteriales bacterium]